MCLTLKDDQVVSCNQKQGPMSMVRFATISVQTMFGEVTNLIDWILIDKSITNVLVLGSQDSTKGSII
jgi:hypothetical protein